MGFKPSLNSDLKPAGKVLVPPLTQADVQACREALAALHRFADETGWTLLGKTDEYRTLHQRMLDALRVFRVLLYGQTGSYEYSLCEVCYLQLVGLYLVTARTGPRAGRLTSCCDGCLAEVIAQVDDPASDLSIERYDYERSEYVPVPLQVLRQSGL